MNDLTLSFIKDSKGYSFFRTEDMFDENSKLTSGIAIKEFPDLATRELDLESIIQTEDRVRVRYEWVYSDYADEDGFLPYDWTIESGNGTIDQDDWTTWPKTGKVTFFEHGKLVREEGWMQNE